MISESALMCLLLIGVTEIVCDVEQNNKSEVAHSSRVLYSENNFTPEVNMTKCADRTLCNDVSNYPTQHVLQVFQRNSDRYKHFFGEDTRDTDIVNRFLDLDKTLCNSVVQLEEPKAGRNKNDEWLFIVNHGNYKQAVEIRLCSNENAPCNMNENFPFRTECRQKYILRKMLALDPKDGQLKEETIKLPSCCSCLYFEKKVN